MRGLPVLRIKSLLVAAVVLASSATAARAHVLLLQPNGGEVLEVGSVYTIRWQIQIAHNLQNWDLWYSTTGSGGPWTPLVMNLPAGSGQVGSVHTYDWTIPPVLDDTVWVRVRMDNSGMDYYDVSNAPFSIVLPKTTKMVIVGPSDVPVFAPDLLDIDVGDTVLWFWDSGGHNVISGPPFMPDGAFDSGDPEPAGTVFEVVFDQDFLDANPRPGGIYDYYCEPHVPFGMVGTIDVLLPCPDCPWDVGPPGPNGQVGPADLAFLLGNWGPVPPDADPEVQCLDIGPPGANGQIGPEDLAFLLGNWGPCK